MFIGTRIEQILSWNLFGTINKKNYPIRQKKKLHRPKKKNIYTNKKNILCQIILRK